MRILFLDINKNGVRIPFTQKRIPMPLVAITLVSIFGLPGASARKVECAIPRGDFASSCTDIAVKSYLSIDPNVPATCELTALCPTMFAGLPPVLNEVFIPADIRLEHVTNHNGTLSHGGKALSGGVAAAKTTNDVSSVGHCLPPAGSYHKTCETDKRSYTSTDLKLANTDLCEATVTCKTLSGKHETSIIYFNIKSQTLWHSGATSTQLIENCDGSLVRGSDDSRCQTSDPERIKAIAEESGRRARVTI